jgi:hypothetical protein
MPVQEERKRKIGAARRSPNIKTKVLLFFALFFLALYTFLFFCTDIVTTLLYVAIFGFPHPKKIIAFQSPPSVSGSKMPASLEWVVNEAAKFRLEPRQVIA